MSIYDYFRLYAPIKELNDFDKFRLNVQLSIELWIKIKCYRKIDSKLITESIDKKQ